MFSDQQLNGLEKRFESQRYLSTPERVELASQLSLSETQVLVLFFMHEMANDTPSRAVKNKNRISKKVEFVHDKWRNV